MSAVLDSASVPQSASQGTPAQRAHRRSVVFMRWLRKVHLYVGLWGAALGLLFGATGILLNHRSVLKIPVEKLVQKTAQLRLPEPTRQRLDSPEQMAQWLQAELTFTPQQTRTKVEPARVVIWGEREVPQPARWSFEFNSPHKGVSAEYFVGNHTLKVETRDATPLGTLTRLHMAVGASVFWVLLSDTIAAGLLLLSITGLLLWSRLHRAKLATVAISLGALAGAIWFMWSATA